MQKYELADIYEEIRKKKEELDALKQRAGILVVSQSESEIEQLARKLHAMYQMHFGIPADFDESAPAMRNCRIEEAKLIFEFFGEFR